MSAVIEQMLKSYHVENVYDRKNAMKEITPSCGIRCICGKMKKNFMGENNGSRIKFLQNYISGRNRRDRGEKIPVYRHLPAHSR